MDKSYTLAWRQFEAGRDYKRRIGLYDTVRRNERYYRGDQWYGTSLPDLPRPVFNIIKRIVDYLVCTVASGDVSISYALQGEPCAPRDGRSRNRCTEPSRRLPLGPGKARRSRL